MHRGLFYFLMVWHLTCMVVYNVSSTVQGYDQLTEDAAPGYLLRIQHTAATFTSWSVIRLFARHTGTATGYGFFAPQVGSSFLLEVTALDARGTDKETTRLPTLKQAHSVIRYHSLLNRMQHLLQDKTDDEDEPALPVRQARAIAHCLTQRIAGHQWNNTPHRLRCEVFVYDSSGLRQQDVTLRHYRTSIYHKLIDRSLTR